MNTGTKLVDDSQLLVEPKSVVHPDQCPRSVPLVESYLPSPSPFRALEFSDKASLVPVSVSTPNSALLPPDEHGSSDSLTGSLGLDELGNGTNPASFTDKFADIGVFGGEYPLVIYTPKLEFAASSSPPPHFATRETKLQNAGASALQTNEH